MNLIERNDLLSDFFSEFRPGVLHGLELLADTFLVSVFALALHESPCEVTRFSFENLADMGFHCLPRRPLCDTFVDVEL